MLVKPNSALITLKKICFRQSRRAKIQNFSSVGANLPWPITFKFEPWPPAGLNPKILIICQSLLLGSKDSNITYECKITRKTIQEISFRPYHRYTAFKLFFRRKNIELDFQTRNCQFHSFRKNFLPAGTQYCLNVHTTLFGRYGR